VAAIAYGAVLAAQRSTAEIVSTTLWFGGGIAVHDVLFAPLCLAVAWAGRRVLPRALWGPLALGAVLTCTLALVAVPVLTRGGAVADNPTVLDRNYPVGLAVAVAVVWLPIMAAVVVRLLRERHRQGRGE
jgi:hypothetical protein